MIGNIFNGNKKNKKKIIYHFIQHIVLNMLWNYYKYHTILDCYLHCFWKGFFKKCDIDMWTCLWAIIFWIRVLTNNNDYKFLKNNKKWVGGELLNKFYKTNEIDVNAANNKLFFFLFNQNFEDYLELAQSFHTKLTNQLHFTQVACIIIRIPILLLSTVWNYWNDSFLLLIAVCNY